MNRCVVVVEGEYLSPGCVYSRLNPIESNSISVAKFEYVGIDEMGEFHGPFCFEEWRLHNYIPS